MPDKHGTIAMHLRCRRCAGTSIVQFDSAENVHDGYVWACPHCFNDVDGDFTLGDRYDVIDVKLTTDDPDPIADWRDVDDDVGTPQQREDYRKVVVGDFTGRGWAAQRGVSHGTVTNNIRRLRDALGV